MDADSIGTLPAPLDPTAVKAQDCHEDPDLVGTGDCSNTLQDQWGVGASACDHTEVRFTTTVPAGVTSLSCDLAFFSTEWPAYADSEHHDLYIAWLESTARTGNIFYDGQGTAITPSSSFFGEKNLGGVLDLDLQGTCMDYHDGTGWLRTTASVTAGEDITMSFAVTDLGGSYVETHAFLDNLRWGCEPARAPHTEPVE